MMKFWSICKNAFIQTIRQPIYGVLILLTFGVLVLDVPLSGFTMETDYRAADQRMLIELGLSTLLVSGLLIAAFSASGAISREIEDRTVLTVISKPVGRATFVLGKFAGVAGAVSLAFYLCAIVLLMTVRHGVMSSAAQQYDMPVIVLGCAALVLSVLVALAGNYFFGWTFTSAGVASAAILMSVAMAVLVFIGKGWQVVPPGHDTPHNLALGGRLLLGVLLMYMAVTIFIAIAVATSTRWGQVLTLLTCFAVFFLGSAYAAIFGRLGQDYPTIKAMGFLLPNLTYFYVLSNLRSQAPVPAEVIGLAAVYCVAYVLGVLALGVALFQRRALEAQEGSSAMPPAVSLLAGVGRIAALLAAMLGLVLVSNRAYHNARGLAFTGGMLAAALLSWIVWGCFGRGLRWSYWLVLALTVSVLGACALALLAPAVMLGAGVTAAQAAAVAVVAVVVLAVLVLPKTRYHFTQ